MSSLKSSRILIRSFNSSHVRSTACAARPLLVAAGVRKATSSYYDLSHTRLPSHRAFSRTSLLRKEADPPSPSGLPPPRSYNYQEIVDITKDSSPNKILIDVREPSELLATGRIPTAKSVPISSAPDAFFMSGEDFETKFGFPRPGEQDEVIFYCKAGVRSRQAALLAGQARPMFGGKVGNYNGSWLDWEKNGGKVEKEGVQGEQSSVSGVTDPGQGRP